MITADELAAMLPVRYLGRALYGIGWAIAVALGRLLGGLVVLLVVVLVLVGVVAVGVLAVEIIEWVTS